MALDEYLHFVAYFQVGVVAELSSGHDAVALVAYVHYYFAFVNRHYSTFHYLIVLDGVEGVVVLLGFYFVFAALLFCFIGIPVEVLERKIFCHDGRDWFN